MYVMHKSMALYVILKVLCIITNTLIGQSRDSCLDIENMTVNTTDLLPDQTNVRCETL